MNMKKCTKDVKELANEACEGLKAGLSVGVALIPKTHRNAIKLISKDFIILSRPLKRLLSTVIQ